MANEPLAGKRMTKVSERKTKSDWAAFIRQIEERYPDAEKITLVMDNLSTHKAGSLIRSLPSGKGQAHPGPLRIRLHAEARQLAQHG